MKTMSAYSQGARSSLRRATGVALLLAGLGAGSSPGQSQESSRYVPAQVKPRHQAAYVLADGSIQVVTSASLAGAVRALNQLFISTHPGVRFTVREGDNYSAMAALTFDRTAFAPLGSEYTRIGLGDNLKIAPEPVAFRIAHASLAPTPGAVPALGVIVHRDNPLTSLTISQLIRIFAIGGPSGDIATWGQAGVTGRLAEREVHPFGPFTSDYLNSDDPQAGEFLGIDKMGGLNMNHRYGAMAHYSDVVQRVSEDPAAIGITALNLPLGGVKVIGLQNGIGATSQGSAADIAAGRYPLDRFVYIYLRVGKGLPLDAFGKEYMRMVLSDEGQQAIAADTAGYIPLNASELAEERMKLDR